MTFITQIKKRSGSVVDFSEEKIFIAIEKAFRAARGGIEPAYIQQIVTDVIKSLESVFISHIPGVEDVQNFVEKSLMEHGFFDIAKSYIIYRYEHTKQREEKKKELIEKIEKNEINVTKRSGGLEKFNPEKFKRSLAWATEGYENIVDLDSLIEQCHSELYDNIKTSDISKALIMSVRAWIEQHPAYSHIASRLLRYENYKSNVGYDQFDFKNLEEQYRRAFIKNIREAVEIGRLDPRMLVYDLDRLAINLVIERDELLMYQGMQTLQDRYFIQKSESDRTLETPQAFWMRIAMGLAINERDKMSQSLRFYDILSTLRFTPSTPTLFNSGTVRPQLSSCYLNSVPDSLDHIFKSYSDNAQLSKYSGGIGTDWTNVRATGAYIKGTGVESQGVIPFLKIANDTTHAINRSGRRRGAACVYLEIWHYDIEDFMELRKNTGDERRRTHDMETACWIPDLFMKRVQEDGEWTIFSPDEVSDLHHIYGVKFEERYKIYEQMARDGKIRLFKTIRAKDLWKKLLGMLYETGHPWITFKDPCNIRSPQDHVGVVHNSNLCTEITLNTSIDETAVCNLGSVNLAKHIIDGELNEQMIKETVSAAMRMLDNVIDINFYPTIEAKTSNLRHRPVGLGIKGFQDALYLLNIPFDSQECVNFADESMEMISYYAILTSSELSHERGAYSSFANSKWDRGLLPFDTVALLEEERGEIFDISRESKMDWGKVRESIKRYGMRNSNCLAIAPTATISTISGTFPCIEPIYKNIYVKSNQTGDFTVVNSYLIADLEKLNLWDYEMLGKIKYHDGNISQIAEIPEELRNKYKEVFEIDPRWLIKAAAHRGKWIDQSQSLNIFFGGSSGKELSDIYFYAWKMGLKTTYYLRTMAASQVEKSTIDTVKFGSTHIRKQSVSSFADTSSGDFSGEAVSSTPNKNVPEDISIQPSFLRVEQSSMQIMAVDADLPNFYDNHVEEDEFLVKKEESKTCLVDDPTCEACQ